MYIPFNDQKRALIVVDLQPAFIKPHNEHIVGKILKLIENETYEGYVTAVFGAERISLGYPAGLHRTKDYKDPGGE